MLEFYLNKLNTIINDFIKTIDEEYTAQIGQDFSAYLDTNTIQWTLIYAEKDGEAFYQNFINHFPKAKQLKLFTLSILHEVGHLETEDEMKDDTNIRNSELSNEEYFNLFNEYIATDWAGNWIEDNFDIALNFDKEIYKIIYEFYEKVLTE